MMSFFRLGIRAKKLVEDWMDLFRGGKAHNKSLCLSNNALLHGSRGQGFLLAEPKKKKKTAVRVSSSAAMTWCNVWDLFSNRDEFWVVSTYCWKTDICSLPGMLKMSP